MNSRTQLYFDLVIPPKQFRVLKRNGNSWDVGTILYFVEDLGEGLYRYQRRDETKNQIKDWAYSLEDIKFMLQHEIFEIIK